MFVAIQSLACADLMVAVHSFDEVLRNIISFPEVAVLSCLRPLLFYSAIYHIILVAAERFVAVIFPFTYTNYVTIRRIRICSVAIWVLSILVSLGETLIVLAGIYHFNLPSANYGVANAAPKLFGLFLLSVLMCFFHGKVAMAARRQRRRIAVADEVQNSGLDRPTKMMLLVVGVFLALWTPFVLVSLLPLIVNYNGNNNTLTFVFNLSLICGTFNSSINILIYSMFNSKLRRAFKCVLTCKIGDSLS